MATKEKPHLLTLPREIRDMIYAHLHHKISLRVQNEYGVENMVIEKAPVAAVLSTHPQLYHEYKDADCFKNLSGVLYMTESFAPRREARLADSIVLSQIRHLDLGEVVYTDAKKHSISRKIDSDEAFAQYIRHQLVPMLPRLKTLRFRTWYTGDVHTDHVSMNSADYLVEPTSVPHTICGLKMVQMATGCDFTRSSRRSLDRSFHRLHFTTYYVYANAKANAKKANFWTLEEVSGYLDGWVKFLPADLEKFEKEREGITAVLTDKVLGWTDQRMTWPK
jgi:hypothetical protein